MDGENLSNVKTLKATLEKYNLHARKGFGQNFLTDAGLVNRIAGAAELGPCDLAVEIGPGLGVLTKELAKRAGRVLAVEIDRGLIPALSDNLKEFSNIEIVNADFLKTDYDALLDEQMSKHAELKNIKVVSNPPYYITTPIIFKVLESRRSAGIIALTVQKEVADRVMAKPGTRDYGILTLAAAYYAETEIAAKAPPSCFYPQPGVESALIKLKIYKTPPVGADKKLLFDIIGAAFSTRRKTLVNCLSNAKGLTLTKEQAIDAVTACGFPANIRGEMLSIYDFSKLCGIVSSLE